MGQRIWTEEQLEAIEARDKTLLVSAAAGSGKTATLTERIIRSLTDEKNPVDVSSLLIVTFTNAAAAELRAKLTAALEEAVAKNPNDKRLERQLFLLPCAKIRTIDSFCNDILRTNCDRVGLTPGYRIADTAECELLAISIIEGLISAVYSAQAPEVASPEEFEELADCLTDSKRTEELSDVLRFVYSRCESSEVGVDSLLPMIEALDSGFESVEETLHGAYLMEAVDKFVDHYIAAVSSYDEVFSVGAPSEIVYSSMTAADLAVLKAIKRAATYNERREIIINASLVTKPRVKNDRTERMERYSVLRDMLREDLKSEASFFSYSEQEWRSLYADLSRLLSVLYRFIKRFDGLFLEEKCRRGALSYADIERLCHRCLVCDGEPTDIAENLASRFSAIYIDEYQDVNGLQNSIFDAISRSNNRFMVGDIKQSIYGFRSARPEIFARMKNSFPPLSESDGNVATVFMSKNFRCDRGIVDFVNGIFDRIFGLLGRSIGYSEGDRLGYAKLHADGEPEYRYPTVCMLDKGVQEGELPACPKAVAAKISELLATATLDDGSPIKPEDIAIILRNASGKDHLYAEALGALGIPSQISGAKDFFLSAEVLLALCLLNSIDNPRRDIYLAGLMCSPLFGFEADDLYVIRKGFPAETLYESLVGYVEANSDYAKGRLFLDRLAYYRAISEGIRVDTLLIKLYRETGLLALASKSGGKENLMVLYDYARGYEAGEFRGLYNFINFINSVIDKKTTFDDKREGGNSNAVKIVTCHSSKGLEYPVVFLVDAGASIASKDTRGRLVISDGFAVSFRLRTPSGLAIVNNPLHNLVCRHISERAYEEELRVLYVALTRARERLFVVGTCPSVDRDGYMEKISVTAESLSEYSARNLSSYLEIILTCGRDISPVRAEAFALVDGEGAVSCSACEEQENRLCTEAREKLSEILTRRFSFKYPEEYATTLPEKMSVSKTSPTILDGTDDGFYFKGALDDTVETQRGYLPAFISPDAASESAERGIATHLFMQFCDLERLAATDAETELSHLVSDGFLSREDAARVRLDEIALFSESELMSEMRRAAKIYREFRFNVRLPASEFTSDQNRREALFDKEVLVQGVIDCIVEGADGRIFLYDYKTDRLTREELCSKEKACEKLVSRHGEQLYCYALAVERIFGRAPDRVEIYSLPLGDTVSVTSKR